MGHFRGCGVRRHDIRVLLDVGVRLRRQYLIDLVTIVYFRWNSVYVDVYHPFAGIDNDWYQIDRRRDIFSWYR